MAKQEREPPGLKSIHTGRSDRTRGKYSRPTTSTWLVGVLGLVGVLVAYRVVSGHKLDSAKDGLLSRQRAVAATVGKEWFPLRDKLERITLDDAKEFKGDFVDREALRTWDFRTLPGLYLRVRVADVKDAVSLRRAAAESAKDGFVGCLLREPAHVPSTAGAERVDGPDIQKAQFPDQPWNLRQAYGATRVLTDDWVTDVKEASDDLRLRVFEQQYEKATKEEIPLAVDVIRRAQFFLLVLDEDDEGARALVDGGPLTEEALQLVPHEARIHLVNARTGAEVVRLRRVGSASLRSVGDQAVSTPETKAAMQRQVNNCSLALQVQAALAPPSTEPAGDAGRD